MQKHKGVRRVQKANPGKASVFGGRLRGVFSACAFFSAVFLFSCKSPVQFEQVEPLALVSGDSSMVVYIPVSENSVFVEYAAAELFGLSKENARTIVPRMSNLVLASDGLGKIQVAVEGNFPKAGIKMAFSDKKGWNTETSKDTVFPFSVYSSKEVPVQVAVPDSKTVLASDDVSKMLLRYEACQTVFFPDGTEKNKENLLKTEICDFLTDNGGVQIRFYAQTPGDLFGKILGKSINLGLNSLSGILEKSKAGEKFALTLNLELSNSAVAKAAVKMLKIALFPLPAKIVQKNSIQIQISDISLSYAQLMNFLCKI